MGITATNKALERIREVDPVVYNILKRSWQESFGDTIPDAEIRARLRNPVVLNSEDTDVEFVVNSINTVLATR